MHDNLGLISVELTFFFFFVSKTNIVPYFLMTITNHNPISLLLLLLL